MVCTGAAALLGLPAIAPAEANAATYKAQALDLNDELVAWGEVVAFTINTAGRRTDEELYWEFRLFAQGVRTVRRDLRRLRAPQGVATEHAEVVRRLGPVTRDLFAICRAARDHSAEQAEAATEALIENSAALRRARRAWARQVRVL